MLITKCSIKSPAKGLVYSGSEDSSIVSHELCFILVTQEHCHCCTVTQCSAKCAIYDEQPDSVTTGLFSTFEFSVICPLCVKVIVLHLRGNGHLNDNELCRYNILCHIGTSPGQFSTLTRDEIACLQSNYQG